MRCRFAFSTTSDGRLLVTMEALWGFTPGQNGKFCVSAVDDENIFIQHVVLANFSKEDTVELIAGVLLAVSAQKTTDRWVAVTANHMQLTALGMRLEPDETGEAEAPSPLGFADEEELASVFMQAPTPVCMMSGPEHVFTFMNFAYLHLINRTAEEDVLGKPVREALHELEGQPFFGLLDNVYITGEPFIGVEVPAKLLDKDKRTTREGYFDFIYHPVRDKRGEVCGILCQATEVTERVLEKHVRESREEQLYRQWAEMEAVYRDSPVGMCLVDAKSLRILRLNRLKAKMLGDSIDNLVGKRISELPMHVPEIDRAYEEVIASKKATKFEIDLASPGEPGKTISTLWNLNPVFDSKGDVQSVACVVVDITHRSRQLSNAETRDEQDLAKL